MRLCFLKIFHTHTLFSSIFSAFKSLVLDPSQRFLIYPSSTGWSLKGIQFKGGLGYPIHLKSISKDTEMVCSSSAWVQKSVHLLRGPPVQFCTSTSRREQYKVKGKGPSSQKAAVQPSGSTSLGQSPQTSLRLTGVCTANPFSPPLALSSPKNLSSLPRIQGEFHPKEITRPAHGPYGQLK